MNNSTITDEEELGLDEEEELLEGEEEIEVEEEELTPDPNTLRLTELEQKLADREAAIEAMNKRFEQFQPLIQEAEQKKQQDALYEANALTQALQNAIDNSDVEVDSRYIGRASELMKKGIAFELESDNRIRESNAATAIALASSYLGPTATIAQLRETANKLMGLNHPRLMEEYVGMLSQARTSTEAQSRATVASKRLASGVDAVVPAPTQSSSVSTFKALERKVGDGTATLAEEIRYEKLYNQLRKRGGARY